MDLTTISHGENTGTDVFRVLADPTRRAVFERLAKSERSVKELKAGFAVSPPAISQHLAALRRAGLVRERRAGRHTFYRAAPEGLPSLITWVDHYRAFWPVKMVRVKTLLNGMES